MAETTAADRPEQTETYEAVTWFEANNADTQSLLFGRHDDGDVLSEPELNSDGHPVRARRYYDPVETIELPETMTQADVIEWVNDHRDHDGFEGYDWDAHDEKEAFATIVKNRNSFRKTLAHFEEQLRELSPAAIETKERLEEIQTEMADAMHNGPAVEVNRVQKSGEDDA